MSISRVQRPTRSHNIPKNRANNPRETTDITDEIREEVSLLVEGIETEEGSTIEGDEVEANQDESNIPPERRAAIRAYQDNSAENHKKRWNRGNGTKITV